MTNSVESNGTGLSPEVTSEMPDPALAAPDDIVSVNAKKSSSGNKAAKSIFVLTASALVLGGATMYGQHWLAAKKDAMKPAGASNSTAEAPNLLNPEKTGATVQAAKLGAASGSPPPEPKVERPGPKENAGDVRPMRGADGKVLVDAQGRAMGVDPSGNVVAVPAIDVIGGSVDTRKPLPGQSAPGNTQYAGQPAANGAPAVAPPSRYGGSLFVDVDPKKAKAAPTSDQAPSTALAPSSLGSYAEILRAVNAATGGGSGAAAPTVAPVATPYIGQPLDTIAPAGGGNSRSDRAGSVGDALSSTATPVARARRVVDQNLLLPKGRQADCVLTGRISDEVPGFTSCVLSQNLYSDNGRVLLLERGSELSGEYGVMNQPGMRRLFVTWNRIKTPNGIEVNLASPGSDALGTSGLPGHLDSRWGERIGAALILSFLKDVSVAVINNQKENSTGTTNVSVQPPGQNTVNAGFSIADEVVKQTLKVRPTLTINEGDKIAIYVARDLDFSPVYALKSVGATGTAGVR